MASSIGWVDFSSTDREKVSQVLAMLREPGTLDELGIGQIRDSYAELLFPGLSTIQTRAKYFITVPRMIRDYYLLSHSEQKKCSLSDYLERQENLLAEKLVEYHKDGETGIIGSSLVGSGKGVARRPSSVYWNGLRLFGLIHTSLSLTEFCKLPITANVQQLLDSEDKEHDLSLRSMVHLDRYIPDWMSNISIDLSPSEAQFLLNKLTHNKTLKSSIFSQLLIHEHAQEAMDRKELENFSSMSRWLENKHDVDILCRTRLKLAREFSDAMEGAHIRYNILIARRADNSGLVDNYESQYAAWHQRVSEEKLFYPGCADEWLEGAVVNVANVKVKSQAFVRQWATGISSNVSPTQLDLWVEKQAIGNKGKRSLLKRNLGNAPSWQGMDYLSYRWPTARTILKDIMDALR